MKEDYKCLYEEEVRKLAQNIDISQGLNQSLSNFFAIQTFITGVYFCLSKLYIDYFTNSLLYNISLVLWLTACAVNTVILIILIWELYNTHYILPIFDKNYEENIIKYIESSKEKSFSDEIYKDWFKTYRTANYGIYSLRDKKTGFLKKIKISAIISIIIFITAGFLLGIYMTAHKLIH